MKRKKMKRTERWLRRRRGDLLILVFFFFFLRLSFYLSLSSHYLALYFSSLFRVLPSEKPVRSVRTAESERKRERDTHTHGGNGRRVKENGGLE